MQITKSLSLLLAGSTTLVAGAASHDPFRSFRPRGEPVTMAKGYPNVTIAGVNVIDTPIVRLAQEFTRNHSTEAVFKHQMRAWLFGSLIVAANETLRNSVDVEIQAVSALLHDLGWDLTPNSTVTSLDHRFEVDGAIAARKFLEQYGDETWDARRIQLVFDAIALHTTRTIAYYKEYEVQVTSMGISVDYDGLRTGIDNATFGRITTDFPNFDLKDATNETFTAICAYKPAQTYDNQLQPWGQRYVPGYNVTGNLRIDTIFKNL